jgi:hypothetical protein
MEFELLDWPRVRGGFDGTRHCQPHIGVFLVKSGFELFFLQIFKIQFAF